MSFSMNTSRMLEPRSLGRAIKPADDAVKADVSTKRVAMNPMENDDVPSAVLTLDDFGGRSDALGG